MLPGGIVASQPLDASPETLDVLRRKIDNYVATIDVEAFQEEMGYPPQEHTRIIIACDYPVHPKAMAVIDEGKRLAAARGIRLELQSGGP